MHAQIAETKNGHKAHQKIHPHYTNQFNELETLQLIKCAFYAFYMNYPLIFFLVINLSQLIIFNY
ncbi:hypothetical protein C3Y98_08710 [Methylotenera oryzisoli]|jgi:hypothetical protein|uniref:Uncharacterized protein n=1 Tax=Methylotenera oryzisoli TaxID=2080758 RepID=A0A4Y9VQM6_9PROT|nr:hypothetical protein C3Y98_08710 [Methylotenera oryzisoli]